MGDFRECHGSVGSLWKTQDADYSFLSKLKEMTGFIDVCAHAESVVPPIEGRIWELWDPIPVSPDTEETRIGITGEDGEVDQPPRMFGGSISEKIELDPLRMERVPFMI